MLFYCDCQKFNLTGGFTFLFMLTDRGINIYLQCWIELFLSFWAIFALLPGDVIILNLSNKKKKKKKKKKKMIIRCLLRYGVWHMYHMCTSYDVWFLRYRVQRAEFFVILGHFCPFTLLTTQKIKILRK